MNVANAGSSTTVVKMAVEQLGEGWKISTKQPAPVKVAAAADDGHGGGADARELPCSTAVVINHPRYTRAARVARASPVAPRAPPALRTERRRSRREDARQGRRPATGRRRKKNRGGEDHHSVRRPCVSAAARAAHACAARPGRAQPTPTPGDSPRRCPRTVAPPARQFAR